MKKDLNYYMKLKYEIRIEPIPEGKGGGYEAFIPSLNRYLFIGDGATIAEALADLEKTKTELFGEMLKDGTPIPEPPEKREDYSGRILLRVPGFFHRALVEQAEANGVSLNQHIFGLLSMNYPLKELQKTLSSFCVMWDKAMYQYEIGGGETGSVGRRRPVQVA